MRNRVMALGATIVILSLLLAVGCARIKEVFAPSEPPPLPARPVQPERREPAPRLSPQVNPEEEGRLLDETNTKIQGTERTLQSIDTRRLADDQQETYRTIHAFLGQAKAALSRKDFPQALNLALKARILSDELVKSLR